MVLLRSATRPAWAYLPAAFLLAAALLLLASFRAEPATSPSPSVVASSSPHLVPPPPEEPPPAFPDDTSASATTVLHVIDGDTVILGDGRRVRYIGMDTPELSDKTRGSGAERAKEANARLVEGRDVRLETDAQLFDRYGRTLAYVWVGDALVNEILLREGFARLLTIPPNVRYIERFRLAAQAGAAQRTDVWTTGTSPAGDVQGSSASAADCPDSEPVKGNINRRGEKIYHLPTGKFYARTRPEECFGSTDAAAKAGYRPSRQ